MHLAVRLKLNVVGVVVNVAVHGDGHLPQAVLQGRIAPNEFLQQFDDTGGVNLHLVDALDQ